MSDLFGLDADSTTSSTRSARASDLTLHPSINSAPDCGCHSGHSAGSCHPFQSKFDTKQRLLGIPKYPEYRSRANSFDYEDKYSKDEKGKEMAPYARVWRVYLDEAETYDEDMIRGFRDSIDALLVFAALFSAVVTTFVVQSSQAFQPNYGRETVVLLHEMLLIQRAMGNLTLPQATPSLMSLDQQTPFQPTDLWINALWFASLAMALATALISVLVKQWLMSYSSFLSGTTKDRALIRHFRFMGLNRWKLPAIVGLLPILLHVSLALFLAGLAVFSRSLHPALSWSIMLIGAFLYVVYVGSAILSALFLDCPYRVPILHLPMQYVLFPLRDAFCAVSNAFQRWHGGPRQFFRTLPPRSLKEAELEMLRFNSQATADALRWLYSASPDPVVRRITVQAIAGSSPSISACISNIASPDMLQTAWNGLASCSHHEDPIQADVWERACYKLASYTDAGRFNHLFHLAAYGGHTNLMELLLQKGVNINADSFGTFGSANPLQLSAMEGREDTVRWLVEHGADVNAFSGAYGDALQSAAFYGHERITNFLLEHGARVNSPGGLYAGALQAAAVQGHTSILSILLEHDADVNAQGGVYGSALLAACSKGHEDAVSLLLDNGARLASSPGQSIPTGHNTIVDEERHPLCIAAALGHVGIVSLVLARIQKDMDFTSLIQRAVESATVRGNEEVVNLLLGSTRSMSTAIPLDKADFDQS